MAAGWRLTSTPRQAPALASVLSQPQAWLLASAPWRSPSAFISRLQSLLRRRLVFEPFSILAPDSSRTSPYSFFPLPSSFCLGPKLLRVPSPQFWTPLSTPAPASGTSRSGLSFVHACLASTICSRSSGFGYSASPVPLGTFVSALVSITRRLRLPTRLNRTLPILLGHHLLATLFDERPNFSRIVMPRLTEVYNPLLLTAALVVVAISALAVVSSKSFPLWSSKRFDVEECLFLQPHRPCCVLRGVGRCFRLNNSAWREGRGEDPATFSLSPFHSITQLVNRLKHGWGPTSSSVPHVPASSMFLPPFSLSPYSLSPGYWADRRKDRGRPSFALPRGSGFIPASP